MKIYYDLDGTVASEPKKIPYLDFLMYKYCGRIWSELRRRNAKLLLRPLREDTILTARPVDDVMMTYMWLNKHNIKSELIMAPHPKKSIAAIALWKSQICKRDNVDIYIDNDVKLVDAMRDLSVNAMTWLDYIKQGGRHHT